MPGPPDSQCSHHRELFGLLCLIHHFNTLCARHNITTGKIKIFYDGEGAINLLNTPMPYAKTSTKHFNMLSSIKRAIRHSQLTWNFSHVKGHQDDLLSQEELSLEAQLNVQADHLAKSKLTECLQTPQYRSLQDNRLPYDPVTAYWTDSQHHEHLLHSNLTSTLHDLIHTARLCNYFITKNNYTSYQASNIDWVSRVKAHSNMTTAINKWSSKWLTGFYGIGLMLEIYKYQKHTKCPQCNADNKTTEHVLTCKRSQHRLNGRILLNPFILG